MTNNVDSHLQSPLERGLQNILVQYQPGNALFASEPDLKEEDAQIWKSHVLIPSSTSSHAYLGLLEKDKSEKTKTFFPHDKTSLPLIFSRNLDKPYNLHYL